MANLPEFDTATNCSRCDACLAVPTEWFGEELHCPECNQVFSFQTIASGSAELRASRSLQDDSSQKKIASREVSETPGPPKSDRKAKRVPKRIGRYEAKRRLGQGGFGMVFAAHDPILRRDVAVKLPYTGEAKRVRGKEAIHAGFEKEARAAARLRHPNIVAVFDHGQSDLGVFIVYEFIPGKTLEEVLDANEVNQDEGVELVATLADALHYAAENGIIHRDIKPANVMIDESGRPQLMDFGLAEAASDGKALTGGKIAGTPIYMSPE
ncbi:MAG: serine/threonine-protein kinase, partial [Planctomycetota bacterium]